MYNAVFPAKKGIGQKSIGKKVWGKRSEDVLVNGNTVETFVKYNKYFTFCSLSKENKYFMVMAI